MGRQQGSAERVAATSVHKVLNNNVVVRIDAAGREQVLMGRGLGFGLRPGDEIDPAKAQKTFVMEARDADRLRELLADVPYTVVEAVTAAIEDAERDLGRSLAKHLAVAVIDHVQFLLTRLDQGIRIRATPMPELRVLHPDEFRAAMRMATTIGERVGVELPEEEAIFLTMHVLSATRDEPNGTAALLVRRVQHVTSTVERELGVKLDSASKDYARFILHVKFLLQRLVDESMLTGSDSSFYEFAKHSYASSHAIAEHVHDYVLAATGSELTDEEMLYLTAHIERLAQQVAER